MGCGNSKTGPLTNPEMDSHLKLSIQQVQKTWPTIKKIDNLGPKIFAHLLHVYPILKRVSNVSPTIKTEADLLRANEVRDLGNMLLTVYSDIIKNAHFNLNEKISSKAIVLNRQSIKPRLVKHFGESLCYIGTHQINIKLTNEEKQSWTDFTNYVSDQLTNQMALEHINE